MPKNPSYPILLDKCIRFDIGPLSRSNFIEKNSIKSGTVNWEDNFSTSRITVRVNCIQNPYINLSYIIDNRSYNYDIPLTSIPSNLGKGEVWYFYCPIAKKKCRKLYLISGIFTHREAYTNCMYSDQIKSKSMRSGENRFLRDCFKVGDIIEIIEKKYFKESYAGKPTRRAMALMKAFDKLNLERDFKWD